MSPIIIVSGILLLVVLFLLFRVQQLTSVLSGDLKTKIPSANKVNGLLMISFFVIGIFLFFYSAIAYWDDMILPLASEHGSTTDFMFWVTMTIVTLVFVFVNGLLFYFAYKYQHKDDYTAYYFPHNNTLEMIWTLVPAVVLAVLIFGGWKSWTTVTGAAPEDSAVIEIMGKQFAWMVRYPGDDNKLGNAHYTYIDDVNEMGIDCKDKNSYDDFLPREIHLVVNKPVLFKIKARDVLHSVFLPHFRQKMDAVPGMPTRMWFTPTKTTAEMRTELSTHPEFQEIDDNGKKRFEKFNYELACTEVCGRGHFAMKKLVIVETQEEYDAWYAKQQTFFSLNTDKACMNEYLPKDVQQKIAEELVNANTNTNSVGGNIEDFDSNSVISNVDSILEEVVDAIDSLSNGEGEEKKKIGFIKKVVEKAKDIVSKDSIN